MRFPAIRRLKFWNRFPEKKILGTKQKPPITFQDRAGCVCQRALFGMVSHKEIHLSTVPAIPKLGITYKHF